MRDRERQCLVLLLVTLLHVEVSHFVGVGVCGNNTQVLAQRDLLVDLGLLEELLRQVLDVPMGQKRKSRKGGG